MVMAYDEFWRCVREFCSGRVLDQVCFGTAITSLIVLAQQGDLLKTQADDAVQELNNVWNKKTARPRPPSMASLSVQLLVALAAQEQLEMDPHSMVNCLLLIVRRQLTKPSIGCDTTSGCVEALSALSGNQQWVCPNVYNKYSVQLLIDALEQQSQPACQQAAATVLMKLTSCCDASQLENFCQWGVLRATLKTITCSPLDSLPTLAVATFADCCSRCQDGSLDPIGQFPLEHLALPTVVHHMLHQPLDSPATTRLLEVLLKHYQVTRMACIHTGVIQGTITQLRHGQTGAGGSQGTARTAQEVLLDQYALQLLRHVASHKKGVQAVLAAGAMAVLIGTIPRLTRTALSMCVDIMLKSVVSSGSCGDVAKAQCVRAGAVWDLRERARTLSEEPGAISSHQATTHLALQLQDQDWEHCLQSLTHAPDIWAACLMVSEPGMSDKLQSHPRKRDVLRVLCQSLHQLPTPVAGHPAQAQHGLGQAVADGLHKLLMRLQAKWKPIKVGTIVQDAVEEFAASNVSFKGDQEWPHVRLIIEGQPFVVLRDALLDASPAFRAMLEGGFSEQGAAELPLPNVTRPVWEVVMRFIYTGSTQVPAELAGQVLLVADQYLLRGLKDLSLEALLQHVTPSEVPALFHLSKAMQAATLNQRCIELALQHWALGHAFELAAGGEPSSAQGGAMNLDDELRQDMAAALLPWLEQMMAEGQAG